MKVLIAADEEREKQSDGRKRGKKGGQSDELMAFFFFLSLGRRITNEQKMRRKRGREVGEVEMEKLLLLLVRKGK